MKKSRAALPFPFNTNAGYGEGSTADDFREIENLTSRVEVKGARYSEGAQKLVNR